MIIQPNQYQIDNKETGDIVYVVNRPFWYKLFRQYFLKDLQKVKIKYNQQDVFSTSLRNVEAYQEDCILIHDYEYMCQQVFTNNIEYTKNKGMNNQGKKYILPELRVTLYNIQLTLPNNEVINIRLDEIKKAMELNDKLYKQIDKQKQTSQAVKFLKYKGDFFKNTVLKRKIKQYIPMYCSVCGKPVKFKFKKDLIQVENSCNCGNTTIQHNTLTYDEFAIWFASQVEPLVKQRLYKFWLKEENK